MRNLSHRDRASNNVFLVASCESREKPRRESCELRELRVARKTSSRELRVARKISSYYVVRNITRQSSRLMLRAALCYILLFNTLFFQFYNRSSESMQHNVRHEVSSSHPDNVILNKMLRLHKTAAKWLIRIGSNLEQTRQIMALEFFCRVQYGSFRLFSPQQHGIIHCNLEYFFKIIIRRYF